MPDLQFAQQANGKHLNARQNQNARDHEKRSMRVHHVLMGKDFEAGKHQRNAAAEKNAERAKGAEEMQRTRHVLQQEANGQQVEEDTHGARNTIVRLAPLAVHIPDRNLADAGAIPGGERRDEAMHLAIERDVVDHLTAIRLEGGAKVVNVDAGKLGHQPVGATRRNAGA